MDIGKLLLLGAAGFVAYEYLLKPSAAIAAPAGGILPAPPTPVSNPSTTQNLILAEAAKNRFSMGTADDWGWYYQKVRGIPAPDPGALGFTPDNVGQMLTFPEWWATASAHGLAGYQRSPYGLNPLSIMGAQ